MFTESTMDDIAHFDIAPQILNLLTIIDSLHLKILRLASREFLANLSSGQFFLQILYPDILQIVTSSSYSRQLFFLQILQIVILDTFLANCRS